MADQDDNRGKGADKDKTIMIIVNARQHPWTEKEISFEEVVKIAFSTPPPGAQIVYTVTYRKAEGKKPEGSLAAGQSARVKDGTTFNVSATDKS